MPTTSNKLNRILGSQSSIKGIADSFGSFRLFFKAKETRLDNKQYNDFMRNIYSWSQKQGSIQKKQHDDSVDSLAGLIQNVLESYGRGKAKTIDASKSL